jgi:hypothetical protein
MYLWGFYSISKIFPLIDENTCQNIFSLQQGLGRIGILGVTLLAFISGYGSIAGPSTYIFVKKATVEHVESAERNFSNAERLLEEKRDKYREFCELKISGNPENSTLSWFIKRVSTAITLDSNNQDGRKVVSQFFI